MTWPSSCTLPRQSARCSPQILKQQCMLGHSDAKKTLNHTYASAQFCNVKASAVSIIDYDKLGERAFVMPKRRCRRPWTDTRSRITTPPCSVTSHGNAQQLINIASVWLIMFITCQIFHAELKAIGTAQLVQYLCLDVNGCDQRPPFPLPLATVPWRYP